MNQLDKVLIIEDEKPAARSLCRKLESRGFMHIQMCHSVEQSRSWLTNHPAPDLIFMDIQLSDGLSFEALEGFNLPSKIIFTTAYNEFALRAFKLNSIDYLLKPVMEEELDFAIKKYQSQRHSVEDLGFQALRSMLLEEKKTYKTRFNVKIGQQIKLIPIAEIECFFSENKGTYLYCKESGQLLLDYSLDRVEELLDPKIFFRINRGQIIAIHAIKGIAIHANTRLKVYLNHYHGEECIVSRERVSDFKGWLE